MGNYLLSGQRWVLLKCRGFLKGEEEKEYHPGQQRALPLSTQWLSDTKQFSINSSDSSASPKLMAMPDGTTFTLERYTTVIPVFLNAGFKVCAGWFPSFWVWFVWLESGIFRQAYIPAPGKTILGFALSVAQQTRDPR